MPSTWTLLRHAWRAAATPDRLRRISEGIVAWLAWGILLGAGVFMGWAHRDSEPRILMVLFVLGGAFPLLTLLKLSAVWQEHRRYREELPAELADEAAHPALYLWRDFRTHLPHLRQHRRERGARRPVAAPVLSDIEPSL